MKNPIPGWLVLVAILCGCCYAAYRQGFSDGAHAEYACWKQVPHGPGYDVVVGHRDRSRFVGGKPTPRPVFRMIGHIHPVNDIPSTIFP